MDTKISALTAGITAIATDRIPAARSPFGSTDNVYLTPAYLQTLFETYFDTQYDAIGSAATVDASLNALVASLGSLAFVSNLTGVVTSTGGSTAIADAALSIAKTNGLQAALDAKQTLDATLTALAALDATAGLLTQTAADTFVRRSLDEGVGIDITNPAGTAGNPSIGLSANAKKRSFGITIDGGGSAITTGIKGDIVVPFDGTITGWTILADQSGSIVIDVWKDTYTNYPPTVADTIAGSEKPTLASASKNQDLTLSTWTVAVTAGDIIRFNVDSITTVTRVLLSIDIVPSS